MTCKLTLPDFPATIIVIAFIIVTTFPLVESANSETPPNTAGQQKSEALPEEPPGYRNDNYRTPTPARLTGAITVSDDEAMKHWQSKRTLFIDVMPRPERPPKLPAGTLWRQPKRENIPGSYWLPNTGYGVLSPKVEAYYRDSLKRLTEGDLTRPILIYCLENCWMSWNAAKRALAFGYRNVYWYPAGTDGWARIGGPLENAEPLPLAE